MRVLQNGGDPVGALESSIEAGKEAIAKWNKTGCLSRAVVSGRAELHRNECEAESIALGFHTGFVKFCGIKPTPYVMPATAPESRVRFEPAIIDGSGYCGPVCLSSLTGLGTRQIGCILREQFQLKAVRGVTYEQMEWFIKQAGYQIVESNVTPPTIANAWTDDGVYLVELKNHWLLLRGQRIVCTEFSGQIRAVANSRYRRDAVVATYEIQGELSKSAFDALVSIRKRKPVPQNQLTLF